ncbi:MAG: hypothetical protein ACXWR1_21890 [Bdellovibrionota bacterium]
MRHLLSLLLVLPGLLAAALPAIAVDGPVPTRNRICADDLNTPAACRAAYAQFACGTYSPKKPDEDSAFVSVLKARCQDDPYGTCLNAKPDVASRCGLDCERVTMGDRRLVCTMCKTALVTPATPSTPPAHPENPPPSVPPVSVGGGPTNTKTPPGQPEGGSTETPSGRAPASPPGKAGSTVTGNGCDSSEQCQREANDTDRAAEADARARRQEYLRGLRESRDTEVSTVSGAADFLNTWKRQIDSNPAAVTADTRAKFQSDQSLVQKAQAAFPPGGGAGHGSFTAEDALRANNDGIMRELSMTVESAAQVKDFSNEAKKAKAEEDKFHALALETDRRVQGLQNATGSTPSFAGGAAAIAASSIATSAPSPEAKPADSGLALDAKFNPVAEKGVTAKAAVNGSLSGRSANLADPGAAASGTSSELRERLRKRLADRSKTGGADETHDARDALDGTTFGRTGGLDPSQLVRAPASAASPAGKSIAEEVMGDFSSLKEKRFTMKGSDIDAELHRLTLEASEAGLLGEESVSLFDRVRRAHKSCLQRDCVNGR